MRGLFSKKQPPATVAFNMRPVRGPWGGSSAFVSQMERFLRSRGYRVTYKLEAGVDLIVLVDPRDDLQYKSFGMPELIQFKKDHPHVKVLHRVNECDLRKKSNFMDALLAEANPYADCTVFISRWLLEHHAEKWFDMARPHAVVYNGADPAAFHPIGSKGYSGTGPFRIVTHHWADSRIKGFDEYEALDRMIHRGELPDTELVVIGRWPDDVVWKAAETYGPLHGHALADHLKTCHAYITASKWEPCGMHHVEGAQCGLPLLYHEDGGGINEAGERYGVGFRDDLAAGVAALRQDYDRLRARLFSDMPSGDRMCMEYTEIIQKMLCGVDGT